MTGIALGLALPAHAQDGNIQGDLGTLNLDNPIRMDLSGSWEKDFTRSDNWEEELTRLFVLRRNAAERDQGTYITRSTRMPVTLGNRRLTRRGRGANLVDLARLAEYISRQNTIEIQQDREEIRVIRRGEADLVCGMSSTVKTTFESEFGNEICGWDRQQLVFEITLPDDLLIIHRFSVSGDFSELQLLTSIVSKGNEQFNLNTFYYKYDAPSDAYNCVQTLSRGRVCSLGGSTTQ